LPEVLPEPIEIPKVPWYMFPTKVVPEFAFLKIEPVDFLKILFAHVLFVGPTPPRSISAQL
jgi:hypothetical protein